VQRWRAQRPELQLSFEDSQRMLSPLVVDPAASTSSASSHPRSCARSGTVSPPPGRSGPGPEWQHAIRRRPRCRSLLYGPAAERPGAPSPRPPSRPRLRGQSLVQSAGAERSGATTARPPTHSRRRHSVAKAAPDGTAVAGNEARVHRPQLHHTDWKTSADIDRELEEVIFGGCKVVEMQVSPPADGPKAPSSSANPMSQARELRIFQRGEAHVLGDLSTTGSTGCQKKPALAGESPADATLRRLSEWRGGALAAQAEEKPEVRQLDARETMAEDFAHNLSRVRNKLLAVQEQFAQHHAVEPALPAGVTAVGQHPL